MYLSDLSDMRESANKERQILEYDPDYTWEVLKRFLWEILIAY